MNEPEINPEQEQPKRKRGRPRKPVEEVKKTTPKKRGRPRIERPPKEPKKRGRKQGTKLVDVLKKDLRYKNKKIDKDRLSELIETEKKYKDLINSL